MGFLERPFLYTLVVLALVFAGSVLRAKHRVPTADPRDVEHARLKCQEYYDAAKYWRVVKRRYPKTLEEMEAPLDKGEGNYLWLQRDPWGHDYVLEVDGSRIRVFSPGPDGDEGTDDDVGYPDD